MRSEHGFHGPFRLRPHAPGEWLLLAPLRYRSPGGRVFGVPAGFVTDLASIPWPARPVLDTILADREERPAVLHDWLYCSRIVTRKEADALFLEALELEGIGWTVRRAMWLAVRAWGWRYWNKRAPGIECDDFAELPDDA